MQACFANLYKPFLKMILYKYLISRDNTYPAKLTLGGYIADCKPGKCASASPRDQGTIR